LQRLEEKMKPILDLFVSTGRLSVTSICRLTTTLLVISVLTPRIASAAETLSLIEPQSASAPIRTDFEAVDVHVRPPEERRGVLHADEAAFSAGRYEIHNATMLDLITTAYSVEETAVFGGPSWLALDRFDVIAKPQAKR